MQRSIAQHERACVVWPGWPHYSIGFFYQSCSWQGAVLQVRQPSSTIRLAFDEFEAIDVSLHRLRPVGKCESGQNRGLVALDTASKGEETPDGPTGCATCC